MKHLNSIPGFQYVTAISESGNRARAMVSGDYFQIIDCARCGHGVWEGVIVHHLRFAHLHGLQHDDHITFRPPEIEPHALLQDIGGLFDKLNDYPMAIDSHVAECAVCREQVIQMGLVRLLPKLFAEMTVPQPDGWDLRYHNRHSLLEKMRPGQCLPCGCQVTSVPWTHDQAVEAFYKALAEVLHVNEIDSKKVPSWARLLELPLSTISLRRLRDKFWLPDGSSGSEEVRDTEEGDTVRQLPETVGQFITEILKLNSGLSYTECSEHWYP